MGGPRLTGGWPRCSFEPSTLLGMAGGSGLGLAAGNEPRTLVRHVIQRADHDSGYAVTQRRLPHANELRHSRSIRSGTTWNGVETITKHYWWGSLPWSRSSVGSTRDIRTPSLSANGSTRAVETQYGPTTVRSYTIMNTSLLRGYVNNQ